MHVAKRQPSCLPRRSGITLLEVLFSMGVLLIGLCGVATLVPLGRLEMSQAARYDHAAMIGRGAFRDLKARGLLDPRLWHTVNSSNTDAALWDATNQITPFKFPGAASNAAILPVMIDPLGLNAGYEYCFPFKIGLTIASGVPSLGLARVAPGIPATGGNPAVSTATAKLADLVFRTSDDLRLTPGVRDNPPTQQIISGKRASDGNYSWLATVVPDPTQPNLAAKWIVSVAVLYKRDLSAPDSANPGKSTETRATSVTFPGAGIGGGEVTLSSFTSSPVKPLKPGQWLMLAGKLTNSSGVKLNYYRWYRVVAADRPNGSQQSVTLAGTDWNPATTETEAWIIDNVVAVYEKNMRLDLN